MDDYSFYDKIRRLIESRRSQISETLMGGNLKDMEMYKFLQGELSALYYIESELKDLNKD
tara:strand:- start:180 stop:359 length:180 start_codon:yes stop_codon:yes gene_type:complete